MGKLVDSGLRFISSTVVMIITKEPDPGSLDPRTQAKV